MDLTKNMEMTNEDILEYASNKLQSDTTDEDMNLMDLSDDSVIEKLNAFVGSIGEREYLVPEKAVNGRNKLMRVGINFGDVQFTGEEGEISLPLVKHGGFTEKILIVRQKKWLTKLRVVEVLILYLKNYQLELTRYLHKSLKCLKK